MCGNIDTLRVSLQSLSTTKAQQVNMLAAQNETLHMQTKCHNKLTCRLALHLRFCSLNNPEEEAQLQQKRLVRKIQRAEAANARRNDRVKHSFVPEVDDIPASSATCGVHSSVAIEGVGGPAEAHFMN